jgi:hypothetical protein
MTSWERLEAEYLEPPEGKPACDICGEVIRDGISHICDDCRDEMALDRLHWEIDD